MIHIGLSPCFMYPDSTRKVFSKKTLAYVEQDMARFVSKKGVMPILIPELPEEELEDFLTEMDAFVFQGGSDIAPQSYKEELIEDGKWPGDLYRDRYELKIMDHAFKNMKPILAICRGFQLANVYLGGTLHQDLKTTTKTLVEHRNAELYDEVYHKVTCRPEGLLKEIYHQDELYVNSVHHQGIKTLGRNLVVDAISSEDELIEAFHYRDLKDHYLVGVQWHPEFSHSLPEIVSDPSPLYDHFLDAVKSKR